MAKHKKIFKAIKKSLQEAIQIAKDIQDPQKLKQLQQNKIITTIYRPK